jgi:hypothetical protein
MNAPTLIAIIARTPTTQPAAIAALLTPLPLSLGVGVGDVVLEMSGAAEAVTTTVLGLDGSVVLIRVVLLAEAVLDEVGWGSSDIAFAGSRPVKYTDQ